MIPLLRLGGQHVDLCQNEHALLVIDGSYHLVLIVNNSEYLVGIALVEKIMKHIAQKNKTQIFFLNDTRYRKSVTIDFGPTYCS